MIMDATMNGGLRDYEAIVSELHTLDERTDVGVLKQIVVRYSAYHTTLTQGLKEQVSAGTVEDEVLDQMHVTTELLMRAVARLSELGAVKMTS